MWRTDRQTDGQTDRLKDRVQTYSPLRFHRWGTKKSGLIIENGFLTMFIIDVIVSFGNAILYVCSPCLWCALLIHKETFEPLKIHAFLKSASRMNTVLVRYGYYVHTKRYEKKTERKTRSKSRYIDENKIVHWLGETFGIICRIATESHLIPFLWRHTEHGW